MRCVRIWNLITAIRMTKERRIAKIFTLPLTLTEALETRAAESGEKMSRMVERGIRLVLALPPVEDDEERDGLGPTRSERVMLDVLRKAGPGWHHTPDLARASGLTIAGVEKALKALERSGEAFCWGPGRHQFRETGKVLIGGLEVAGSVYVRGEQGTCWATERPLDVLGRMLAAFAAGKVERRRCVEIARTLALGVADAGMPEFRAACVAAFWPWAIGGDGKTGSLIQNFAELEADALAEEEQERADREEQRQREAVERAEAERAHDAEQKRLDAEFRAGG